jgi:hypothetical protein
MAFGWEMHRDEICDLYLYQDKTLKQVISHMQEKYGLTAWYVLGLPIGMSKLSLIDIASEPIGRSSGNGAHKNMRQCVTVS